MKTEVITMQPALVLQASSWEGETTIANVYWHDLMAAPSGKSWAALDSSNCGRDMCNQRATVVFSTPTGAAVLVERWGTTDEDKPQPWKAEPQLLWFEWGDFGTGFSEFHKKQFHVPFHVPEV